jgi:hypothetical protein
VSPRVRMGMSVPEAERLADLLLDCPPGARRERYLDQLWLRTVLAEQERRMRIAERDGFRARAERVLAVLDPEEAHTAAHNGAQSQA